MAYAPIYRGTYLTVAISTRTLTTLTLAELNECPIYDTIQYNRISVVGIPL